MASKIEGYRTPILRTDVSYEKGRLGNVTTIYGKRPSSAPSKRENKGLLFRSCSLVDIIDQERINQISNYFELEEKVRKGRFKMSPTLDTRLVQEEAASFNPLFRPKEKVMFYKSKSFQHFDYLSNLIKKCSSRVGKIPNMVRETQVPSSDMIKIRYIGHVTADNMKSVSKRKEQDQVPEDTNIWNVSPLICFQNDLPLETAQERLRAEDASHKILVKSKTSEPDNKFLKDEKVVIVEEGRLQEAIAYSLEEPLRCLLNGWRERLKTMIQSKQIRRILSEIDGIQKQMSLEESSSAPTLRCSNLVHTSIVPANVKKYLFSNPEVNSFGMWKGSIFKVFVKSKANRNKMQKTLIQINENFFEEYRLEIENKKVVETLTGTLKQGNCISSTIGKGTLGAFVTKHNDSRKKYGLTCGHIFPKENIPAFKDEPSQEIGKCVFSTRDMPCDFAAIEINDSVSDHCDTTFRRNDNKKTNAKVYDGNPDDLGIVHKNGAVSGVTDGTILSSEFYVKKLIPEEYQDSVFFVRGTEEHFSLQGDSGSLVFSRPQHTKQNYVNVVGMVYGNNVIINDLDESEKSSDEDENVNNEANGSGDTPSASSRNEEIDVDPEHVSSCFRIRPALYLFEKEKDIPVKFKDDLTSSSSTSSDEAS